MTDTYGKTSTFAKLTQFVPNLHVKHIRQIEPSGKIIPNNILLFTPLFGPKSVNRTVSMETKYTLPVR